MTLTIGALLALSFLISVFGLFLFIWALTQGLMRAGPDAAQQQGLLDYMATTVPLGRVGDPDEVASVAAFLASSESSYIAGTEIFVDGGQAQV